MEVCEVFWVWEQLIGVVCENMKWRKGYFNFEQLYIVIYNCYVSTSTTYIEEGKGNAFVGDSEPGCTLSTEEELWSS